MNSSTNAEKAIVITSIFPPTEAVHAFAALSGFDLIVCGDAKSPSSWECNNATYLSLSEQSSVGQHLSSILPQNHYCRKMVGYIYAIKNGAQFIIDTDDDNIPKDNWKFPEFEGSFDTIPNKNGFVNIYQLYTDAMIWPRGLPLHLIKTDFKLEDSLSSVKSNIGIWQGLADEDPDVDAIYRLTSDAVCLFKERNPVVLEEGTFSPFNSQNTIVRKELFPLLYLPTYVTFRFTDILRSYIAQPIMWMNGYKLGFTNATVIQKRNPHDYFKDFVSEIPMYQYCNEVIEVTTGVISSNYDISGNLYNVYDALRRKGIVIDKELQVLEAWLLDIQ